MRNEYIRLFLLVAGIVLLPAMALALSPHAYIHTHFSLKIIGLCLAMGFGAAGVVVALTYAVTRRQWRAVRRFEFQRIMPVR